MKSSLLLQDIWPDLSWWNGIDVRREVFAGFVVALLVIPQAISFAYLAGLPPEYGIYCAVYTTLFASLFGNSTIIGGPNTAVAIMIGNEVILFAGRGSPFYIEVVMVLSLLVGLIQLTIWIFRGGRYFQYFSPSAIIGITTGVGFLILFSALEGLFGIDELNTLFFFQKFSILFLGGIELINPFSFIVGLITVCTGLILRQHLKRTHILVAAGIGVVSALIIHTWMPQVITEMEMLGHLPLSPLPITAIPWGYDYLRVAIEMLPTATSIAFIGLAQTMVIAKGINLETQRHVSMNKETFAQATANILSPFFSTFAGSGSFNRTALSHQMGAKTPLAGIISSTLVLLLMLLFGDMFAYLPMAAMAGMLFIVGLSMIKPTEIIRLWHTRQEFFLFLITFTTVIFMGLHNGIIMAMIISLLPFMLGASKLECKQVIVGHGLALELYGNFFYATLDKLHNHMNLLKNQSVIINLRHVSYFDYGAAELILRKGRQHKSEGLTLIVATHTQDQIERLKIVDRNNELVIVSRFRDAKRALIQEFKVLDVGVELFNQEHQRLLFYIEEFDRLYVCFSQRTPYNDELVQVARLFRLLDRYTQKHFQAEEALLQKHGYPDYEEHRRQHEGLTKTVGNLKEHVDKWSVQHIGIIRSFLREKMITHVNIHDMKYRKFFQSLS